MTKVDKIPFSKLSQIMNTFNDRFPEKEGDACLSGVIVFKASNWKTDYSLESRSYRVWNNNRAFQTDKISNSLSGDSLDGTDKGVRLDWYGWDVDYCYMD